MISSHNKPTGWFDKRNLELLCSPGLSGRHSANADQMPTYTGLRSPLLCKPRWAFMSTMPNADVKCRPNLVTFVNFINYKLINKTGPLLYRAMTQWLSPWIPNPRVPCSKPLGGSKVSSVFHPCKVARNVWELSGNK